VSFALTAMPCNSDIISGVTSSNTSIQLDKGTNGCTIVPESELHSSTTDCHFDPSWSNLLKIDLSWCGIGSEEPTADVASRSQENCCWVIN